MALAVKIAEVATPLALVVAVLTPPANVPLAPVAGAANVTTTPLTGLLPESLTVATSGVANEVLIAALCGVPPVAAIEAAAPGVLVSKKFAGAATPATVAVTVYDPAVALAVKTADVATPLALVVAVFTPPANVPLAPLAGALNVTVTPLTGLLPASFTVATSTAANAVLMVTLCGVPLVAMMLAAAPAVFVSEKFAGVAMPTTVAVTVYGPPAVAFAVKVDGVAKPAASVTAFAVGRPPVNDPLAPLAGAVNVTVTPDTPLPPLSFTVAVRAAKAVLMATLCVPPDVTIRLAAAPAVFVKEKLAGTATPGTVAVTV